MRFPTCFLACAPLCAAFLPAQHTILFVAGSADRNTLAVDAPEVDLMRSDEIYEITPTPGLTAPARPFLPISLQHHYVGDLDNDGIYVEDDIEGAADTLDCVFIKVGTVGPVTPRDVYWSVASASTASIPGLRTSDVLRYSGQGVQEFFLTHPLLNAACGLTSTSTSLNLDALCQSAAGDLFFSQSGTTAINGTSGEDGDLWAIPASAVTYDVNGNVSALAAGSAVRIATEDDLVAMVIASGHRSSVGGVLTATSSIELSGLEIDPNGGTWTSPQNATTYPNLLFCWSDFSNDAALISTANGGSIGVVNGVPMGSTVATLGDQLGILPDSTGTFGPNGFALVPIQPPTFTLLNYPRNQYPATTVWAQFQLQSSGGTPGGFTIMVWSPESSTPGGTFPALPAFPPFTGEFGISSANIFGAYINDALGNAMTELFLFDMADLHGLNLACQALDFTTSKLSTPTAASFL